MELRANIRGSQLARLVGRWRVGGPDYLALAEAVRGLLMDGRLPLAARLPAERELADALTVSRTTVSAAYGALREAGYLVSRRGAGSWTALPAGHHIITTGLWAPVGESDMLDFGAASPAAPPGLVDAVHEAAQELPRYASGPGYHPLGLGELRAAIARWYTGRGLATEPAQVIVTSGAQQAVDLLLRLLVAPGEPVLVECPTYPNALAAAAGVRARVVSHGLGPDGWDAELLEAALLQTRARVAYLIPDFQNPSGHVMPAATRRRTVAAAHAAGTDLVVDETFVELTLDGEALPAPTATSDRHARVHCVGAMSKAFWGGLRIGWIRAAPSLIQRLAAARAAVDLASPVLDQLVAVRLLERSEDLLPARRAELKEQRDALVAAVYRELPGWRCTVPRGGVALWVELDAPMSSALVRVAEAYRLRLAPGPRFGVDGTLERFLRLPFTRPVPDLEEAVRRLAAARANLDNHRFAAWSTPAVVA